MPAMYTASLSISVPSMSKMAASTGSSNMVSF
jgi:hypothetical protein